MNKNLLNFKINNNKNSKLLNEIYNLGGSKLFQLIAEKDKTTKEYYEKYCKSLNKKPSEKMLFEFKMALNFLWGAVKVREMGVTVFVYGTLKKGNAPKDKVKGYSLYQYANNADYPFAKKDKNKNAFVEGNIIKYEVGKYNEIKNMEINAGYKVIEVTTEKGIKAKMFVYDETVQLKKIKHKKRKGVKLFHYDFGYNDTVPTETVKGYALYHNPNNKKNVMVKEKNAEIKGFLYYTDIKNEILYRNLKYDFLVPKKVITENGTEAYALIYEPQATKNWKKLGKSWSKQ